jgi:hypothetical protein
MKKELNIAQKVRLKSLRLVSKSIYILHKPFILLIIGVDLLTVGYWAYYCDTAITNTIYGYLGSVASYSGLVIYLYKLQPELKEDVMYLNQTNSGGFSTRPAVQGSFGELYPDFYCKLSEEIDKIFHKHLFTFTVALIGAFISIFCTHLKIFIQ